MSRPNHPDRRYPKVGNNKWGENKVTLKMVFSDDEGINRYLCCWAVKWVQRTNICLFNLRCYTAADVDPEVPVPQWRSMLLQAKVKHLHFYSQRKQSTSQITPSQPSAKTALATWLPLAARLLLKTKQKKNNSRNPCLTQKPLTQHPVVLIGGFCYLLIW